MLVKVPQITENFFPIGIYQIIVTDFFYMGHIHLHMASPLCYEKEMLVKGIERILNIFLAINCIQFNQTGLNVYKIF